MEEDISEAERERQAYAADHLDRYLRSGGADGHIVDGQDSGGHRFTTTLLLRYIVGKSGRTITTPLVYGSIGGEVVIAASRARRTASLVPKYSRFPGGVVPDRMFSRLLTGSNGVSIVKSR